VSLHPPPSAVEPLSFVAEADLLAELKKKRVVVVDYVDIGRRAYYGTGSFRLALDFKCYGTPARGWSVLVGTTAEQLAAALEDQA